MLLIKVPIVLVSSYTATITTSTSILALCALKMVRVSSTRMPPAPVPMEIPSLAAHVLPSMGALVVVGVMGEADGRVAAWEDGTNPFAFCQTMVQLAAGDADPMRGAAGMSSNSRQIWYSGRPLQHLTLARYGCLGEVSQWRLHTLKETDFYDAMRLLLLTEKYASWLHPVLQARILPQSYWVCFTGCSPTKIRGFTITGS